MVYKQAMVPQRWIPGGWGKLKPWACLRSGLVSLCIVLYFALDCLILPSPIHITSRPKPFSGDLGFSKSLKGRYFLETDFHLPCLLSCQTWVSLSPALSIEGPCATEPQGHESRAPWDGVGCLLPPASAWVSENQGILSYMVYKYAGMCACTYTFVCVYITCICGRQCHYCTWGAVRSYYCLASKLQGSTCLFSKAGGGHRHFLPHLAFWYTC